MKMILKPYIIKWQILEIKLKNINLNNESWAWTYIKVDAVGREHGLQYCDLAE